MSGRGISWAICKSAPRSRQITMPAPHHLFFLQAGCPTCRPTNSVKAMKASTVLAYELSNRKVCMLLIIVLIGAFTNITQYRHMNVSVCSTTFCTVLGGVMLLTWLCDNDVCLFVALVSVRCLATVRVMLLTGLCVCLSVTLGSVRCWATVRVTTSTSIWNRTSFWQRRRRGPSSSRQSRLSSISTRSNHPSFTTTSNPVRSCYTHTHPLNVPLSGTTRVSRYQKGKTNLDFTEARDSEWQWHPLGHMQVCASLQSDNQSVPHHSVFYWPNALPAAQPTASKHCYTAAISFS